MPTIAMSLLLLSWNCIAYMEIIKILIEVYFQIAIENMQNEVAKPFVFVIYEKTLRILLFSTANINAALFFPISI